MSTAPGTLERHGWKLGLLAMLACVGAYLLYRNLGMYPTIFADEWYYSKMARLMPLEDAIVPSYLYLWMFSASKACGDNFLDCVRIGNIVLYLGAAPFIYLVARTVAARPLAFAVATLAMLAPLNAYTAYFMPEATYFFGFSVLSWFVLTRTHLHFATHALVAGAMLGAMSLVKEPI